MPVKLETITVSPGEQRVLLMFDPLNQTDTDSEVRAYLTSNSLEPRRRYQEAREDTEYEVYYFGHCYIEEHLDNLTRLATGN